MLDRVFSRLTVGIGAGVFGAASWAAFALSILLADGMLNPSGGTVGGDFTAFWTAAKGAASGAWTTLYDPGAFEAALSEQVMQREKWGLTWQYPPHAALLLAPLGALPYLPGYLLFAGGTLAAFLLTFRRLTGVPLTTLAVIAAAPVLFQTALAGQIGTGLGALLLAALLLPDRKPVVAGLCAGLLTIKPQLGILLPVAYLSGGHTRAFGTAALTAGALVLASIAMLGTEAWAAWAAQAFSVAGAVEDYPMGKMITVYAALRSAGQPEAVAMTAQALAAATALYAAARLWHSGADPLAKASLTACLLFLCTPYAYYYDAAILALPVFYGVARLEGPAIPDRLTLTLIALSPLWVVQFWEGAGAQIGLAALLALVLVLVRLQPQNVSSTPNIRSMSGGVLSR